MADWSFRIDNRHAPYRVMDGAIRDIADSLAKDTAAKTPRVTGTLAAGWGIEKVMDARWRVVNRVYYGRFVEFGTRDDIAQPVFGRELAVYRQRYSR